MRRIRPSRLRKGERFDARKFDNGVRLDSVLVKRVETDSGDYYWFQKGKKWFSLPFAAEIEERPIGRIRQLARNFDKEWTARVGQGVLE